MTFPIGWTKEKKISLNGNIEELNQYQTEKVNVPWETGMREDFGDIRFYLEDQSTEIPYLLDIYESGNNATFKLKPDVIPENGLKIWMIFGNAEASTTSLTKEEFYEEYIDFENATNISPFIQRWGTVELENDSITGKQALKIEATANQNEGSAVNSITENTGLWEITLRSNNDTDCHFRYAFLNTATIDDLNYYNGNGYELELDVQNSVITLLRHDSSDILLLSSHISNLTDQHILSVTRDENGNFEIFFDGTSKGTITDTTYMAGFITEWLDQWSGISTKKSYINKIIRSKFTSNPPEWGEWGETKDIIRLIPVSSFFRAKLKIVKPALKRFRARVWIEPERVRFRAKLSIYETISKRFRAKIKTRQLNPSYTQVSRYFRATVTTIKMERVRFRAKVKINTGETRLELYANIVPRRTEFDKANPEFEFIIGDKRYDS